MAKRIVVRELITRLGFELDRDKVRAYGRQVRRLKGGLRDAGRAARRSRGALGGLTDSLGSLKTIAGAAIGAALVGGMGAFLRKTIAANQEFETLKTRLSTLIGPEEAVEKFAELEEFAAKTPFQLNELADAFINLSGPGFDVSEKNLTALGDIAAASGKDLSELVNAILSSSRGLANMVDNFSAVGLKARKEGGKLLLINEKLGEQKLIDPDNKEELLDFFVRAGEARGVRGGMEKLSETIGGRLSTLRDNVASFFREVGKAGFNEAFRELLMVLTEVGSEGDSLAKTLGEGLATAIRGMTAAIRWAREHWEEISGVFRLLAANRIGLLTVIIGLLTGALVLSLPVLAAFSLAMFLASLPVLALMAALTLLGLIVEDLYGFFTGGESVIGDFIDSLMKITAVRVLVEALMWAWKALRLGFLLTARVARRAFDTITGYLHNAARVWSTVFGVIRQALLAVWLRLRPVVRSALAAATEAIMGLWNRAVPVLTRLRAIFESIFAKVKATVQDAMSTAGEAVEGLIDKVEAVAGPIADLLGIDVGAIQAQLQGAPGALAGGNAAVIASNMKRGRAAAGSGAASNNARIAALNVKVEGTTDMGPAELSAAAAEGTKKGMLEGLGRAGQGK